MAWKIEIRKSCKKELSKLDVQSQNLIERYLERVAQLAHPKDLGRALGNNLKGLWRYPPCCKTSPLMTEI